MNHDCRPSNDLKSKEDRIELHVVQCRDESVNHKIRPLPATTRRFFLKGNFVEQMFFINPDDETRAFKVGFSAVTQLHAAQFFTVQLFRCSQRSDAIRYQLRVS